LLSALPHRLFGLPLHPLLLELRLTYLTAAPRFLRCLLTLLPLLFTRSLRLEA
jgi:hypothetical protein